MEHEGTLTLESDWLPASELSRLLSESSMDFPALSISAGGEPAHRGLDPTIAVAIITGIFSTLVPFVTKLAERIFAHEPDASVIVGDADGKHEVVVRATLPAQARDKLLQEALSSGALRVRISLDPPSS